MEPRTLLTLYTVSTVADGPDNPDGQLTFREAVRAIEGSYAIPASNPDSLWVGSAAFPGQNVIWFGIGSPGTTRKINLSSGMDRITKTITINALTQGGPTYSGVPLITIDGGGAGLAANGLTITSDNSVVKGLAITGFKNAGISVQAGTGTLIQQNYIGLNGAGDIASNVTGIELTGSSSATTVGGTAGGVGNFISGNIGVGVLINGTSSNIVAGNFIGTDATGVGGAGNSQDGVKVDGRSGTASKNTIGGTLSAARNVIADNGGQGISLIGSGATGTLVQNNYIGTDRNGTGALGNGGAGVNISDSSSNTIGGPSRGNLISANTGDGVLIQNVNSTGNVLQGNTIGLESDGLTALGNGGSGVTISDASSNTIGGTANGDRNLISGNKASGVNVRTTNSLTPSSSNVVQGNYVGSDSTGRQTVPNSLSGIVLTGAPDNTIGGSSSAAGNLVSGNGQDGILIQSGSDRTVVMGNAIGVNVTAFTTPDSAGPLANHRHGVHIVSSNDNTIGTSFLGPPPGTGNGGSYSGRGNVIAFNAWPTGLSQSAGVYVESGVNNAILQNLIYNNLGLGIDLAPLGANQQGSNPGTGANDLQNAPVIKSVTTDQGVTKIRGKLVSAPTSSYLLEFYANPATDPRASFSARSFVGSLIVTTDASGQAILADPGQPDLSVPWSVTSGSLITATATRLERATSLSTKPTDTSEISNSVTVNATSDLSVTLSANPSSLVGLGLSVQFTATVTNTGPDTATGVVLTDTTLNQVYPIGTLGPGASAVVTMNVLASTPTPPGQVGITKTVTVTGDQLDPKLSNNQASAPDDPNGVQVANFGGSLAFSSATDSVPMPASPPGTGTYNVAVTRSAGFNGTAMVDYTIVFANPSDAQFAPPGYVPTPGNPTIATGTLTFADGITSQTISVPTFTIPGTTANDVPLTLTLSNVRDNLVIAPGTNDQHAVLGSQSSLSLTIVNTNPPPVIPGSLQFGQTSFTAQESDSAAIVTITRTGGSGGVVTVLVSTADGTGKAGVDYTATTAAVTFADGDITPKTVSIPLRNNTKYFGNTTFTVNLSTPTGQASLGTPSSAVVTIQESDSVPPVVPGTLQLTSAGLTIKEDDGKATLTVLRTDGSDGTVTIGYSTVAGTAVSGRDFVPTSGTLTFNPGQTSQTITVPVLRNNLVTGALSFLVQLGGVTGGASLGSVTSTSVTVLNVDRDTSGPIVTGMKTVPSASGVGGFVITFDRAMSSFSVAKLANYQITLLGPSGVPGGSSRRVSVRQAKLDSTGTVVTVTLSSSQPLNRFYQVRLVGSSGGLMGANGNLIDGNGDGVAGGSYSSFIGRGTSLTYIDASGNQVALSISNVSRGGGMEVTRTADGQGDRLSLFGIVKRRTLLVGTVRPVRFGATGGTTFNTMDGVGSFGDIRTRMTTPPITVTTVNPKATVIVAAVKTASVKSKAHR
jgi:hypothetical protein